MSAVDDTEFVEKLIDKTEKFVADELAKVRKELVDVQAKQSKQEKKIKELENENATLKSQMEYIGNEVAALNTVLLEVGQHLSSASVALISLPPNTNKTQEIYHAEVARVPHNYHSVPTVASIPNTETRKRSASAMTSQIATTMNDLDEEFRHKIEPFYSDSKFAKSDLLNPIQRAFIKYRSDQLNRTNEGITTALVTAIIREGINEHIWDENYAPGHNNDMTTYIGTRLKNERKRYRLTLKLNTSNERLNSYVQQSMEQKSSKSADDDDCCVSQENNVL